MVSVLLVRVDYNSGGMEYTPCIGYSMFDGFVNAGAAVVCRQLSYLAIAFGNGYFTQGNSTVWLDDVQYTGTENFLCQPNC